VKLYLYCRALVAFEAEPSLLDRPLVERTEMLRRMVAEARNRLGQTSPV
jgi:hypothetical protein